MNAANLVMLVLLGGLLGTLGQGIRIAIGVKKAIEKAANDGKSFKEIFEARFMLVSLFIGFVSGGLAVILLDGNGADAPGALSREFLLGIVAAGYVGTDFIEGIMKKRLPGKASGQAQRS